MKETNPRFITLSPKLFFIVLGTNAVRIPVLLWVTLCSVFIVVVTFKVFGKQAAVDLENFLKLY